ncbi:MAG: TolC family protein, partial [Acidobacteria bacterium]|nr:TolC family protein [Acidobacteriota bacterium]
GRVTDADVLALRVHVAAMRQRAIDASGQAAVTRAEINRMRGMPVDTPFAVQAPAPASSAATRDWTAMAEEALRERPDVQRAQAAVALADAGRRDARAAWWPQVAAQGTYQFDGTSATRRASAWVVGGEARWTFQTGLGDRAALKAAAAAEQRARALLEDQRAAVRVDVLSAVRRVESAEAREGVALAAVAQARESERILRDRYDAGLVSVQDVLAAAASVMAAETLRIEAVADRLIAGAALDRARGRGHR